MTTETPKGFRCGGTHRIRHPVDPKKEAYCPGCMDCMRCHGSRLRYVFERVMVGPNQQAFIGGPTFTLAIGDCPGCPDCLPTEPPAHRCGTCARWTRNVGGGECGGLSMAGCRPEDGPPWPDCRFWKLREEKTE